LLFIFILVSFSSKAQLTITGRIVDAQKNPLTFVNITVKKSNTGTISDDNGEFRLSIFKKKARIAVSFLGFKSQTLKVNSNTKFLEIILEEDASELDEIIIIAKPKKRLRKKENPAYRILKEIWRRKKTNGLKLVDAYQYQQLLTTEVGLNNLDSIFLKNLFKKDYKNIISQLPYNQTGVNYYVPLYLNEKLATVYGDNKKNLKREVTEAEKNGGAQKEGFVFQKLSNAFNDIDIYKNNVTVLKKSFVSPISTRGFETYDYLLYDSIVTNNKKKYQIYFFPRRNGDLAFEGSLWVADKNFAVTKIKMKIRKDINLNFARNISFEKEFTINNDSIYLPKKDVYSGDFTFADKDEANKGLSILKINYFSNYLFNTPLPAAFYSKKTKIIRQNQFKKSESYWDTISNSRNKSDTYTLINDVKNNRQVKNVTNTIRTLSSGYLNVTPTFQIGKFWNVITKNSVEGLKLKLGFRTFKTVADRFRFKGFLAYGTRDKRNKFALESKYLLSQSPRIAIGLAYLYDVEQLGGSLLTTNGLNAKAFDPNALFSRGNNFFLSFVNRSVFQFDVEVKKNFHIGFSFAHNKIRTATKERFQIDYLNQDGIIKTDLTDVSTDLYFTYTPGRFEFGYGVEQKLGNNIFPALIVNYRKGYKNLLNGSYNYNKIQFNYKQPILLGKLGTLLGILDAGKTFGTVPISLLSPIPANQTFWITNGTFSLINYYDFVTDTYASGHFEHHFNGLIFNKIPLIKKLNLRSVVSYKTVYGSISEENIAINRSNVKYAAPTDKLYSEYGVGFENIGYGNIRPLRIDYIWRGNHTSINGLPTPKSAIRIGIKSDF
jgi:hypothetical protein